MSATSWTQIEKLVKAYLRKPGETTAAALDRSLKRAEDFAGNLTLYFVRKHPNLAEARAAFCVSQDGVFPEWGCHYDEASMTFLLNPVGVLQFTQYCQEISQAMATQERPSRLQDKEAWSLYRLNSYKAELRKLPSQLHLFLLLFQEMARVLEVTHVEHRKHSTRHDINPNDLDYLNFLWAFRELEKAYDFLIGGDLRTNTHFTWWEPEWLDSK